MKIRRYSSITYKFLLPICVVLLAALGAIMFAQHLNNRRIVFAQVQTSGTNLLDILEETLVVAPELFDRETLNDIVLRFAKSAPGVIRISISDRSSTIIADSEPERIDLRSDHATASKALQAGREVTRRDEHENETVFHISHPLLGAYDPNEKSAFMGVATIEISVSPIQQALNFAYLLTVGVVSFVVLFLGLCIYYLARHIMIGPINVLSESARRFGRGELSHRIALDRRDELGQLAATLNEMSRDLEENIEQRHRAEEELVRKERLATVGQLTATVSHELRNPLGAIRSATDAIKKLADETNPQLRRAVALLDRSQRRCDKVIADLLDFTRVRELNRSETAVDAWLGDLLDEYEVPPEVTLRRDLASGARCAVDRHRFERAVRNVIDNACHAMADDPGGQDEARERLLTVATCVAKQRLEVAIGDSGPGVPSDQMARIFEPLYSTKAFGVGLGLPMVKQIAEQHGGGVEIASEIGAGTEVVLWLPLETTERGAGT